MRKKSEKAFIHAQPVVPFLCLIVDVLVGLLSIDFHSTKIHWPVTLCDPSNDFRYNLCVRGTCIYELRIISLLL